MLDSLRTSGAAAPVSAYAGTLRAQRLGNAYQFNQSSLDAVSGLGAVNPVRSALLVQQSEAMSTDYLNARYAHSTDVKLSKFGQVQSALAGVKSSLENLTKPEQRAPVKAASTNVKVATVESGDLPPPPATLQINIAQLAQVQKLESASFDSADSVVGSGKMTFNFGRVNPATGEQAAVNKKTSVTISAGDAGLGGIAKAINRSDAGVRAEVVTEGGASRLRLIGEQTGADNAFTVSVLDNDSSNTDQTGLSRLASNPAQSAGDVKNQTTTQIAQDASLTINDRVIYSASNSVRDTATGTAITLVATGRATLELTRDRAALTASIQKLVDTFNTAREKLSAINDGQAKRELTRLQDSLNAAQSGLGLDHLGLTDLGIDQNASGSLTLNATRLTVALDKNIEGVVGLVADAVTRLSSTAQNALDAGSSLSAGLRLLSQQSSASSAAAQGGGFSLLQSGGSAYSIPYSTLASLQRYITVSRF